MTTTPDQISRMDEKELRKLAEEEARKLREWVQHEERKKEWEEAIKRDEEWYSAQRQCHAQQCSTAEIWARRHGQTYTPWPVPGSGPNAFEIYRERRAAMGGGS
jgi:hypothetical protein